MRTVNYTFIHKNILLQAGYLLTGVISKELSLKDKPDVSSDVQGRKVVSSTH